MMGQPRFSTTLKYPLFVAVNNDYITHLLTMLLSLFCHNKGLISNLFVLSAIRISILNRLKLNIFGLIFNVKVNYIIVNKSELNFQNTIHGHVGIEAFLRLFIPAYCPKEYKYALYLDSDIIINGSIVDFIDVNNMNRIIINAVEEVGATIKKHKKELGVNKYFNSGVLCINIQRWNKFYTKKDIITWINEFSPLNHPYWDQDLLNININEEDIAFKDVTYNYTNLNRLSIVLENPRIIHFTGAGANKPWAIGCRNPFRHTYWKYRKFIDPFGAIKFKLNKLRYVNFRI